MDENQMLSGNEWTQIKCYLAPGLARSQHITDFLLYLPEMGLSMGPKGSPGPAEAHLGQI